MNRQFNVSEESVYFYGHSQLLTSSTLSNYSFHTNQYSMRLTLLFLFTLALTFLHA